MSGLNRKPPKKSDIIEAIQRETNFARTFPSLNVVQFRLRPCASDIRMSSCLAQAFSQAFSPTVKKPAKSFPVRAAKTALPPLARQRAGIA